MRLGPIEDRLSAVSFFYVVLRGAGFPSTQEKTIAILTICHRFDCPYYGEISLTLRHHLFSNFVFKHSMLVLFRLPLLLFLGGVFSWSCLGVCSSACADELLQDLPTPAPEEPPAEEQKWPFEIPPHAIRLSPKERVWVDTKKKVVLLDGEICLRQGQLEMFACPRGIKEHESVVSARARPRDVHTALLLIGAIPGRPVRFRPKYVPAQGMEIEITVQWFDKKGKLQQAKAQQWVKNVKTQKALQHPWVFAGSGFWTDEESGKRYYQADGGDFICVSNFSTAMLDLPVSSSQSSEELLYEAFTKHIPPVRTKVRLILKPKIKKKSTKPTEKKQDSKPAQKTK